MPPRLIITFALARRGRQGRRVPTGTLKVRLAGKATRAAFAKALTITVAAGRIDASAGVPATVARKLHLKAKAGGAAAARIASRGFAAGKRLRKVTLTIKVSQAGATGRAKVKLR